MKKETRTLEGKNGKYLIVFFNCKGTVTIKNTPTDEGNIKLSGTANAIIIVIIILSIILPIVFLLL